MNNSTNETLQSWENDFVSALERIPAVEKNIIGVLLPLIPDRSSWDAYLTLVKSEWHNWRSNLLKYPACLLFTYAGLAFYEYDENTLWPQFAEAVGVPSISGNHQQDINKAFAAAAMRLGFNLKLRNKGSDFIGSAVNYIGVPLSLWGGFLDICEWALWRNDWKALSIQEWSDVAMKRAGGRQRLKRFLLDNSEAAKKIIQEMLDIREILLNDTNLKITSIAQASILRREYFDEVPETAEFLNINFESLFPDRPRLVWNEQRRQLYLQLPGVVREQFPALWQVGSRTQAAATCPDVFVLNDEAFQASFSVNLKSHGRCEAQRLGGIDKWGLFDVDGGGRLVNQNRDELPLKNYIIISRGTLKIERVGFDEHENSTNEPFELSDGTICYVTRLWPTDKLGEIRITDNDNAVKSIRFKTRSKIEAQIIIGQGAHSAYFARMGDFIKVEKWPVFCVSIPNGYFRDNEAALSEEFKVFIDNKLADGDWVCSTKDDEREYYFWKWIGSRPVIERVRSGKTDNLRSLRDFFCAPALKGQRVLSVKSKEFNYELKVYKDDPKPGMEQCWKKLPGVFLPMFLLCQAKEGMKWDDLVIAKGIVSPESRLSYFYLKRYSEHGYLEQRGHRWYIRQSRAEIKKVDTNTCVLNYCGDPSILWGLYRLMYHQMRGVALPSVDVVNKRGEVPYLEMVWPIQLRDEIAKYLKRKNVLLGSILWIH